MIDTELSPRPTSPALRTLGWVGLWLCSASLLPLLAVWTHAFSPQHPLRLMHPGTSLFWIMLGLYALFASLVTFSVWSDQRKPKRRRAAPVPAEAKSRWRSVGAGALLAGFLVLRLLAGNSVTSVNWIGVVSGIVALGVLMALFGQCTRLVAPPPLEEPASLDFLSPPIASPLLPGVRMPKNKYRAEVSAREVIYHRPLSGRIVAGVGGLFFASLAGFAVWMTLLSLELIYVPGMQMRLYPVGALLMGGGSIFFVLACLALASTGGPRVLRVSPTERTYTYRLLAPMRSSFLASIVSSGNGGREALQQEMGLLWRTVEFKGSVGDIAGIKRLETTSKSTTTYSLFLCWHTLDRPPMRVGFSTNEDKARALQAQAAEDLGVPLLPDAVIDGRL